MLIALFIGDHKGDTLPVRLGWWAIRHTQGGKYAQVTHTECIHAENTDGTVTIASSSLRDGGVRTKENVRLNPKHWMIVNVPSWYLDMSKHWFACHDGEKYDLRGALATRLPGVGASDRWFCNEADGASVGLAEPDTFGPHHFAAICMTLGYDVTQNFFGGRP